MNNLSGMTVSQEDAGITVNRFDKRTQTSGLQDLDLTQP